jgi:hypothetical protein
MNIIESELNDDYKKKDIEKKKPMMKDIFIIPNKKIANKLNKKEKELNKKKNK